MIRGRIEGEVAIVVASVSRGFFFALRVGVLVQEAGGLSARTAFIAIARVSVLEHVVAGPVRATTAASPRGLRRGARGRVEQWGHDQNRAGEREASSALSFLVEGESFVLTDVRPLTNPDDGARHLHVLPCPTLH